MDKGSRKSVKTNFSFDNGSRTGAFIRGIEKLGEGESSITSEGISTGTVSSTETI